MTLALDLEHGLGLALAAAEGSGRTQLVGLTVPLEVCDPLAIFEGTCHDERSYWERPEAGHAFTGLGVCIAVEADGPDRFKQVAGEIQSHCEVFHALGETVPAQPLWIGGFGFDSRSPDAGPWRAYPAARWVLPRMMFSRNGGRSACTVARVLSSGESVAQATAALLADLESAKALASVATLDARSSGSPAGYRIEAESTPREYRLRIFEALGDIAAGDLEKVVVARSVRLEHAGGLDPTSLLAELRRTHPSCACFAFARGASVFLGATPEPLLRRRGANVDTVAVAGSAARGRSPEEDETLGRELCESKKEQEEHAVVVRGIREVLEASCDDVRAAESPRLLKLEGIQHLATPIDATLRHGPELVELAGALHPPASVAGAPRDAALAWIDAHEGLERGWYAGAVGFLARNGDGEFWVALRSALLEPRQGRLFAGAGIVAGSQAESELRETRLKLRTLLTPLLEI